MYGFLMLTRTLSRFYTSPELRIALEGMRFTVAAVLLIGAAIVCLLTAISTTPIFFGNRTLVIMNGSMKPTVPEGSALVVQPVASQALPSGDRIVLRQTQDTFPIVRQVLSIGEPNGTRFYIVMGDANSASDSNGTSLSPTTWTPWYHVPLAGYLIAFATSQLGSILLIGGPLALLLALQGQNWLNNRRHAKSESL